MKAELPQGTIFALKGWWLSEGLQIGGHTMHFYNGTKAEDFADVTVRVIVMTKMDTRIVPHVCYTIVRDGELYLDLTPNVAKKRIVKVPPGSILSKNDDDRSTCEFVIMIKSDNSAGGEILDLLGSSDD
jgi:hypothetical protein